MRNPLLLLANTFIDTFGITKPPQAAAERAARVIGALLLLVALAVSAFAVVLHLLFLRT